MSYDLSKWKKTFNYLCFESNGFVFRKWQFAIYCNQDWMGINAWCIYLRRIVGKGALPIRLETGWVGEVVGHCGHHKLSIVALHHFRCTLESTDCLTIIAHFDCLTLSHSLSFFCQLTRISLPLASTRAATHSSSTAHHFFRTINQSFSVFFFPFFFICSAHKETCDWLLTYCVHLAAHGRVPNLHELTFASHIWLVAFQCHFDWQWQMQIE